MRVQMKKRKYLMSVILGFLALYVFFVLAATFLERERIDKEYSSNAGLAYSATIDILSQAKDSSFLTGYSQEGNNSRWQQYYYEILNRQLRMYDRTYQHFSGAIYDQQGNLLLKSDGQRGFLNDFPESIRDMMYSQTYDDFRQEFVAQTQGHPSWENTWPAAFFTDDAGQHTYFFVMRVVQNRWLATLEYMTLFYLMGLAVTLAAAIIVVYSMNKIHAQRMSLEETRRDFMNVILHELKTPLSVIRNFAEIMMEHVAAEKRNYYLEQIVGQTEKMDRMVKEMVYISRLDSENLALKKEPLSFTALIKEQLDELDWAIKEKNLQVYLDTHADLLIEGDRHYVEKAIWNLLANAVSYNIPEGNIRIDVAGDRCTIENTGPEIPAEDLPHVCDMFFTGQKSRTSSEKHLGLGLYLAKRICELHKLELKIENTQDGVRVMIRK